MGNKRNYWNDEKIKLLNEAVKNSTSWPEVARKMNSTKASVKYAGRTFLKNNDYENLRENDVTKSRTRFKDEELEVLRSCIRSSTTMGEVHQKMNSMGFHRSLRALKDARIKFLSNSFLIGEDSDEFKESEPTKERSKNSRLSKVGKAKNQKKTISYGPLFEARSVQTTVSADPPSPLLKDTSDIQDKVNTLESIIKKIYEVYEDAYRKGYEDGSSSAESKMIEKILRIYKEK